ncbi:MAG TPA: aldehyde dehydrogenase family protein [Planctomycetota bacterium]|nr:aldehyde dehydrogenase family protein [Planctomycetota bacterium]HQB00342.1 aldehyde dehydrogenase family protein [Planctomycetota bacterium]
MNLKDISGVQEVHSLVEKARVAQEKLLNLSQSQIDQIVANMVQAGLKNAEHLARLAAGETSIGRVESKILKNRFAVQEVYKSCKDLRTVGVIGYDETQKCFEIAEPVGIIAAIIPTTNPTSTTLFKALISLKSRNPVIFAPHPRAVRCIFESAKIMHDAAVAAGAPRDCIGCIQEVSLTSTQELMKHKHVNFILATGGPGLVEAAYKSGKPAIGVGQGNAPAYIDRSADIQHAVKCIVESQMFDYGTVCASEQSVVVDQAVLDKVRAEFQRQKAYFLSPEEVVKLSSVVIQNGRMNANVVGHSAFDIAQQAQLSVPIDTTVLLAPLEGVGADYPLSHEKLCPVLGFYVANDWQTGCERCIELLCLEGKGHTLVIHATNPDVILEFGLQKPVSRILVNAPSSQGGVGLATHLVPSLTLGCGTYGGNITSDNISAMHLIQKRRVATIREDFSLWPDKSKISPEILHLEFFPNFNVDSEFYCSIEPFSMDRDSIGSAWEISNIPNQTHSVSCQTTNESAWEIPDLKKLKNDIQSVNLGSQTTNENKDVWEIPDLKKFKSDIRSVYWP